MKFDGKHIGGMETGPIRFGFRGDEKLGQQYVPIARQFVGDLKRRMQLSLIEEKPVYQQEDFTVLPDGTVIYANSMFGGEGAADIDDVIIDTRKTIIEPENKKITILGYILIGLTASDDDPGYNNYLWFVSKFGEESFDPFDGSSAPVPIFDNYPDRGAKYVDMGASSIQEVFLARYDRVFDFTGSSTPERLDYVGPTGTSNPVPIPDWYWTSLGYPQIHTEEVYDTYYGTVITMGTHDFLYLRNDNPPFSDYATPEFLDAIDAYRAEPNPGVMDAVNALYQQKFDRQIQDAQQFNEHFYNHLDTIKSLAGSSTQNWVRKHKKDYGFSANMGLYKAKADNYIFTDRNEKQNGVTTGQGFLYMVPSDPQCTLSPQVIQNNIFHEEVFYENTSSETVFNRWVPDQAFLSGTQSEDPISFKGVGTSPPSYGFEFFTYTPISGESSDIQDGSATSNPFNINCKVKNGLHKITIKRLLNNSAKSKVKIILFTTIGEFSLTTSELTFEDGVSKRKLEIPIGVEISPEDLYRI